MGHSANKYLSCHKKMKKIITIMGVLIAVVLFSGCTNNKQEKQKEVGMVTDTQKQEEVNKLTDKVVTGDFKWKVISAEDLGKEFPMTEDERQSYTLETTDGKFIQVKGTIEYTGNDFISTKDPLDIVDSKGRKFPAINGGRGFSYTESTTLTTLFPGKPEEFIFNYEVPSDTTGLKLKVDNAYRTGEEVISEFVDLGL
jgi:hypothetical protein